MVNTNVFLGLMKIAGYSQKSLAKEIGMSENTMSLKVNNKAVFNTDEIEAICCDDAQKSNIFLFSPSQKCNGVTAKRGDQMLRGALWTKKLNAVNIAFI